MSPYLRIIIIIDDKTEGPGNQDSKGHKDRLAIDVPIYEDNNNNIR